MTQLSSSAAASDVDKGQLVYRGHGQPTRAVDAAELVFWSVAGCRASAETSGTQGNSSATRIKSDRYKV